MRRSPFRQNDLTKALKAAKAAGSQVARIEIAPDGKMVVVLTSDPSATQEDEPNDFAGFLKGASR
jgi:hypothetical protein